MLKVVTVCGLGVGSSLIMKTTVESALDKLNVDYKVEHWDMGTIKSQDSDIIVTTENFRDSFDDEANVVYVNNIVDNEEIESKLKTFLENNQLGGF